jgi:hypothetical protein
MRIAFQARKPPLGPLAIGLWCALASVSAGQEERTEALVLDANGTWCVWVDDACQRTVAVGAELAPGTSVRASGGTREEQRGWFLWMVLKDGRYLGLSCAEAQSCANPITIPSTRRPEPAAHQRIWEAVRQLFAAKPQVYYSSALSRGDEDCAVREGVARVADGGLELGGMVVLHGNQPCVIQLRRITDDGRLTKTPVDPPLRVSSGTASVAAHPVPGLYRIEILDTDREPYLPSGTFAWIRIVDAACFGRVAGNYAEAHRLTSTWGEGASVKAQRSFLRAYLGSLGDCS